MERSERLTLVGAHEDPDEDVEDNESGRGGDAEVEQGDGELVVLIRLQQVKE